MEQIVPTARRVVAVLAVFILLSVLTIRFTYMANFPNGDLHDRVYGLRPRRAGHQRMVLDQVDTFPTGCTGTTASAWPTTTTPPGPTPGICAQPIPQPPIFRRITPQQPDRIPGGAGRGAQFDRFDPFLSRDLLTRPTPSSGGRWRSIAASPGTPSLATPTSRPKSGAAWAIPACARPVGHLLLPGLYALRAGLWRHLPAGGMAAAPPVAPLYSQ
jgi:hypothetical protein